MPNRTATFSRSDRQLQLSLLPLLVLMLAALLANAGVEGTRSAHAATDSVLVDATVSPTTSTVTNGCAADTMSFAVAMGGFSSAECTITFGATNSSGITLSVDDASQGDQFMPAGTNHFVDATSDCSAMAASDQVGWKVGSGGTATVSKCVASAFGTNSNFSDVPNDVPGVVGADTACTTNALGDQTCPIAVGILEAGSNAPAGTYSGTITLTSS